MRRRGTQIPGVPRQRIFSKHSTSHRARLSFARARRGFSLIELLVAMLVFAILVAIAVARYRNMKERGYLAEMKTDLGNLRVAEEAYWSEHGQYVADQTLLDYKSGSRVTVTITVTDPYAGYDAEAVHVSAPAVTCTMYVGRASASGTPSGEIACH